MILEAGDRRRVLVATVLTVAALPFLWSAKQDQAAGSTGVLPALSAAGGITLGPPAEARNPELVEPAFLGGSVETAPPKPLQYDVAAAPSGQNLIGKAGYRRLATSRNGSQRICQTSLVPYGTRIVVTNTDNGFKVDCTNVNTQPIDVDLVLVLDTNAFTVLTDLAESPIPVELSW